jgi:hypothetical protein
VYGAVTWYCTSRPPVVVCAADEVVIVVVTVIVVFVGADGVGSCLSVL